MFFSWVRRGALKGQSASAASILLRQGPGQPQMVVIVAMAALFMGVGLVMYTRVQADAGYEVRPSAVERVTKVDGKPFPIDGVFDLKYLPNGHHKISYGSGESAFTRDVDVNNDLGPLVAVRNWAFGWLHGNKPLVDKAVIGTLIGVGLLFVLWGVRHWLRYRIRSNVR